MIAVLYLHPKMTAVQILAFCEAHAMSVTVDWTAINRDGVLQPKIRAIPELAPDFCLARG
jgi:hypothetical protein